MFHFIFQHHLDLKPTPPTQVKDTLIAGRRRLPTMYYQVRVTFPNVGNKRRSDRDYVKL